METLIIENLHSVGATGFERPKPGALPDCATPRLTLTCIYQNLTKKAQFLFASAKVAISSDTCK